ncbi:uncharacterized protein LOC130430743 [Triplophysa dalaica]|uniref:uncharacterized protein LOC130430743 n=1 Tax=Triplophysa dalaica TaxID=1582913 RepID=UPI0024E0039A|nr:uncharacterized protein LOC130430743 [Triplophysa dalaica]XP_056615871.1 uncharacterized protein LOC130430743 [Triplophysa dalaica]
MKTTPPLLFYLLLCCQTTESLTRKRVILGGNVTLDCKLDNKEIYWLFMKPPESLVVIFRTFTSESTKPAFFDQRLKSKYSSTTFSRLCISNITKDELGIYYCVKANTTGLQISNGTKLYTTETANQNVTEENDQPQQMQHNKTTTLLALMLTSISLNVLLFITLIVLLTPRCRKPRHSPKPHQKVEAQPLDDLSAAEYSEIELPTYSRGAQPGQINGIYTLLEKPKPDARHTKT